MWPFPAQNLRLNMKSCKWQSRAGRADGTCMDEASNGFIRAGTLAGMRNRARMVLGTPGVAVLILADGSLICHQNVIPLRPFF